MTAPEPAERAELTYETATPEQVAQARAEARRKLAEMDAEWTPERWAAWRAKRAHSDAA